ncbi:MAG: hypothetical protein BGO39_02065 [Chloroflexi bacterium 54-19]|nr:MAG: hypothetical protein BGO39_02065 [Chloroflexi bacterium 54-19]
MPTVPDFMINLKILFLCRRAFCYNSIKDRGLSQVLDRTWYPVQVRWHFVRNETTGPIKLAGRSEQVKKLTHNLTKIKKTISRLI